MWPRVPPRGQVAKIKISRFSFTTYAWLISRCNYRGGWKGSREKRADERGPNERVEEGGGREEDNRAKVTKKSRRMMMRRRRRKRLLSCRGNEILTDFIVGWRKQFANVNTCWILSAARERELEGPHTLRPVYPLNLWLPPPTAASTL